MFALTRYASFARILPRLFKSRQAMTKALVKKSSCTKSKGFSFAGICSSFIATLRTIAKPLLFFPPIAALFAWHKSRGADEIQELDSRLSEKQSPQELSKQHQALEKEGLYQFYPAKSEGKKPLVIVSLGTMQDFDDPDAGLMKVVEHVRKNHDAHLLVLKAPHAYDSIKHCFGLKSDASSTTSVRSHTNAELIKDIVEAKGAFADIEVDSVCPISYSWGAGMMCQMRKQGLFENLRIPIKSTVTIDAIQSGLENMGEGLDHICAGDEANMHFYQSEPSFGLNGKRVKDACAKNDQVYCVENSTHDKLDNDPWVLNKICQFMDEIISGKQANKACAR
jgi:hypothetical protein